MSVAILISGQMRTADICIDSIKRHVLARVGPRLQFVHAAADEDAHKAMLFHPVAEKIEPQPMLDEKNYEGKIGLGCYGVQVVLKQLWSLRECWRLMERSGHRPDWVIRLRADCWFNADIEDLGECDSHSVYVPTFHNFYGMNDRFAFGGYEVMREYCNRLDNLDDYIADGGVFHPESHLAWTMQREKIQVRRTRVLFDLIRKSGERVRPQWNHDAYYGDVMP